MRTEPIHLSPVDVEALPGLSDLFAGELAMAFSRELARVVWNIYDTSTSATAERVITMVIGFTPEADLQSAIYKVKKLEARLTAADVPKPSRVVFRRSRGKLEAYLRPGIREGVSVAPGSIPRIDVEALPGLEELFEGELDDAWRRELVRVLLNIDDPRAETAKERTITIQLAFAADDDRTCLRYSLKRCVSKIVGCRAPKPSLLFFESERGAITLEHEPRAHLPGDEPGAPRRQASIPTSAKPN